ncbi:MAG: hypothetical protein VB100_08595 [Angelakisella sp.]|nr:hypothetical protein [Angelakisella sp.]
MAFTKKTWTDRQAEYPGRRKLTATAVADVYDVTREEGLVVEEGDALNAATLNNLETRIEAGLNEKADGIHTHGIADVSGIVPVAQGGTGQTTLAAARNAMGLGNTTGALPVANGGTGATSLASITVGNATKWNNYTIWQGTQAAYDAITSKSSTTIYFIVG